MSEKDIKQYRPQMHVQYTYMKTLSLRSNAFYSFLLLAIIATFAVLPFVYVQVSSSAPLAIQPKEQKETVFSPAGGKITYWGLVNNRPINKGDTIYQYSQELFGLQGSNTRTGSVIANISGTGHIMEGLQVGSFVQGGQKVAEILPDSGLLAVCYVSPKDIAYVKIGQQVQLQIDSYNYYEWGMLNATVNEIFTDLVLIENRPFYIVHCKMGRDFLTLKNGHVGKLLKGMTGRANFVQGKKSLWQLLFTKVNEWFNPKAS
jgi:HlyD family secretion protein